MASLIKTDSTGQTWARCMGCDGWVTLISSAQVEGVSETVSGALHDPVEACQWFFDTDVPAIVAAIGLRRRASARLN